MWLLLVAALVGVVHIHHAPSHDSQARFSDLLQAAFQRKLDFIVLTEHVPLGAKGPLPAANRAGLYLRPDGGRLLVLVGGEFGTQDGHLLAMDIPEVLPIEGVPGRQAIAAIHAAGGFAVVPHPFLHGGWKDWDAPFDGIEVHNNVVVFWSGVDPLLPLRMIRLVFDRDAVMRRLLLRPKRELDTWEELLAKGRRVFAFSGSDAHQNLSLLGWQVDPYAEVFRHVQTLCPDGPLDPEAVWKALRSGQCWIRYGFYDDRESEAERVGFPSGRVELQLDGGWRVLEIRQPRFWPH
jgi:hypothetical protein